MFSFRFLAIFFSISFLYTSHTVLTMQASDIEDIIQHTEQLTLDDDSYYSDSEDEDEYEYTGLPSLEIPEEKHNNDCIPLVRGIHFSPSKFTRQDISEMRRENNTGQDIFCSAAYDLANEQVGSSHNINAIRKHAYKIRKTIKKSLPEDRNKFQEVYTNQYDIFHRNLGKKAKGKLFGLLKSKSNPQVSTGENFLHGSKYAFGLKFLGSHVEILDPAYDNQGKPKHPYLGKLFVLLVNTNQIDALKPYFVAYGHAKNDINISYHYSKNILEEREVSFPGLIPGDCVTLSIPVRVPSFKGDYKPWYQEKFGISKRAYNSRKRVLITGKYFKNSTKDPIEVKKNTVKSLLEKNILPHLEQKLKKHVRKECRDKNINLVYKQLNGAFGSKLPTMFDINYYHKLNKQG